jgi:hypothetical protein
MPEMCERVGKLMDLPLDKCVCADLRTPIERTGGIARYQSFLTEALFYEDLEDLYYALHALVGAKGKSGCDPAALPWAREMFLRTMDSYPPPPQRTMKDDAEASFSCGYASGAAPAYTPKGMLTLATPPLGRPSY